MYTRYLDYSISLILVFYLFYHTIILEKKMNKSINKNAKFVENFQSLFAMVCALDIIFHIIGHFLYTKMIFDGKEYKLTNQDLILKTIGLSFFISGILLRKWCFSILGKFFTYRVSILEDHKLIQEGPYRYLIHPSYTGMMMVMAGIYLYKQFPIKLIIVNILLEAFLFYQRMKLEEKVLKDNAIAVQEEERAIE